ncbi:TniB family NTP-binding protein [Vogesella facilis]|uniref:TniB family NTP-binding protein n=1 Tax=Vogesella facilis TaxID=1655232 RepID=A0ABV7REW6_9NEIS
MSRSYDDIRAKLRLINEICVHYPAFNSILRDMERCLSESADMAEPLCMMVTGDTGVGKSTLISALYKTRPPSTTSDRVEVPILVAEVPLPATIGGLIAALLAGLGAPFPEKGTIEYKRRRLIELLARCQTLLVILDEFQHLVERGTRQRIETVADALKTLINHSRIPFVLVGMPAARSVLEYSPQLSGRFPIRREIIPFNWLDRPLDFERLLECFEKSLPFEKSSGFTDESIPARFFLATGGNFRAFVTLVRDASRSALLQDCACIEREQLACSYDKLLAKNRRLRANPFRETDKAIEHWVTNLKEPR